jgi:putative transposase
MTYLNCLADAADISDCRVHAYVFLPNRIELLCTPSGPGGISMLMQAVGRRYVLQFNSAHGRSGTLWDGRYRAALVEPSGYVLAVYRSLDTLAFEHRLETTLGEYRWSSYRFHTTGDGNSIIRDHPMFVGIAAKTSIRQERYRQLCNLPLNRRVKRKVKEAVRHGLVFGSDAFKDQVACEYGVRVRLGQPGRPAKPVRTDSDWSRHEDGLPVPDISLRHHSLL